MQLGRVAERKELWTLRIYGRTSIFWFSVTCVRNPDSCLLGLVGGVVSL